MAAPDFDKKPVLDLDPWLEPFVPAIEHRYGVYKRWRDNIHDTEGGYEKFTRGYENFGFHVNSDNSVSYREWAPSSKEATLIGDFSLCRTLRPVCRCIH
jgi:1,4-alpha-glucan branching enzyme